VHTFLLNSPPCLPVSNRGAFEPGRIIANPITHCCPLKNTIVLGWKAAPATNTPEIRKPIPGLLAWKHETAPLGLSQSRVWGELFLSSFRHIAEFV